VAHEPGSSNEDLQPVIVVNDRGLTLSLDPDGEWLVWNHQHSAQPAQDRLLWLLPLLERPPEVMVPAVAAVETGEELLSALLRFALASASQYWAGLALGWLEAGYPVGQFADFLAALKDSPIQPQPYGTGHFGCGAKQTPLDRHVCVLADVASCCHIHLESISTVTALLPPPVSATRDAPYPLDLQANVVPNPDIEGSSPIDHVHVRSISSHFSRSHVSASFA
jgi:hypothetical protein